MVCTERIWAWNIPKVVDVPESKGTPANKIAKSCQINRCQLSWTWESIVRKTSLGIVETNQQSFFSKNRLQNSRFFFSKSVKKSVKRGVRVLRARASHAESVSPQSRSLFSASFQTFCLTARAYLNTQKYGRVAVYSKNENRINWYGWPNKITAGLNGFRSLIFDCNNFLQREPKRQLYFVMASLNRVHWKEETCYGTDRWWYKDRQETATWWNVWYIKQKM